MIDLDVSASARAAVIWIINTRVLLRIRPSFGFDLLILVFYCKFCTFRFILLYIACF